MILDNRKQLDINRRSNRIRIQNTERRHKNIPLFQIKHEHLSGHYICHFIGVRVMVFNLTFNNISAISWQFVLSVQETGVPREDHRPVAISHIMLDRVHLP